MNKNIIPLIISVLLLFCFSCNQKNEKDTNKLTAINPLSFTSVVFSSDTDTAFVSTYSGRIAQIIKNDPDEKVIANIDDEIYALVYLKKRKEVIAATLNSGIVVINIKTGKINKSLSLNDSWTINLSVTKDEKYLFTSDLKRRNYIWDIDNNYQVVDLPESLSKKQLKGADDFNKFYFVSAGKAFVWNIRNNTIDSELSIGYNKIVDIDNQGNILLMNHNKALLYNRENDSITFSVNHPSWIFYNTKGEMLGEIPLSLKLTEGKFTEKQIFTGGIDRSIRVWNKESGKLIDSWTEHKATISGLALNNDQSQLVSVDLKGNIRFWDLEE